MFVLIQWKEKPSRVTVMQEPEHIKKLNEGDEVEIEYPKKGSFKGTLMHRSGNNKYYFQ